MYNILISIIGHKEKKKNSKNIRIQAKHIYTILNYKIKIVIVKEFDIEIKLQKVTIFLYTNRSYLAYHIILYLIIVILSSFIVLFN